MARDPIQSLLRLRRMTLDEAKRTIGRCLAQERSAEATLAGAEAAIARETETARTSASDAEVEAFAAWLPVGQQALRAATVGRDKAARETALARAALTLARGATEATENLLERRAVANRQAAERRSQAVLDEVGLRRALPGEIEAAIDSK